MALKSKRKFINEQEKFYVVENTSTGKKYRTTYMEAVEACLFSEIDTIKIYPIKRLGLGAKILYGDKPKE